MSSPTSRNLAGAFIILLVLAVPVAFAQRPNNPPRNPNQLPKQGAPGAHPEEDDAAAAAGGCAACCGGSILMFIFFIVASLVVLALDIALLVWVARDAKNRGMDNAVVWMLLVFFTGLIGFIIYIFSRPQGDLVQCDHCNGWQLQASRKCPHCGSKSGLDDGGGKRRKRRREEDDEEEDEEDEDDRPRRRRSRDDDDD